MLALLQFKQRRKSSCWPIFSLSNTEKSSCWLFSVQATAKNLHLGLFSIEATPKNLHVGLFQFKQISQMAIKTNIFHYFFGTLVHSKVGLCSTKSFSGKAAKSGHRCYDFLNIFAEKFGKNLVFLTQNKAKMCKILIITLFLRKTPIFVIIISAPGFCSLTV
jgi:hypothetical protein